MTVPSVISKNGSLDFSLTGTSVPTVVIGNIPKSTIRANVQRDTGSGKLTTSVDINDNPVLPNLSLAKSTNTMLIHQPVNHASVYQSTNVSSFYINMGTSRKGSTRSLSEGNNSMTKVPQTEILYRYDKTALYDPIKSTLQTAQTQATRTETNEERKSSTDAEGNTDSVPLQHKTESNKETTISDGSSKASSQLSESSSESSEEDNEVMEKHVVIRKKHRRHKKTSSHRLSRLRQLHRSLPCPPKSTPLQPPVITTATPKSEALDLNTEMTICSVNSADTSALEENMNKLQVLPKVMSTKSQAAEYNTVTLLKKEPYLSSSVPVKVTKVFLSERQSGTLKEQGYEFPCAPPATPVPDPYLRCEYIASMADIRAQRAVKVRLEALEKMEQKKREQIRSEKLRKEKQNLKDKERELKHQQRLEIYALNKVMSEFERKNFEKFCKSNGIKS